jgi:hypothetical protein
MDADLIASPADSVVILNVAQRRDALDLLLALPDECAALVFFDPQYRGVLDHLKFGNEGSRQRGRARLPPMSEGYIDECCRELARARLTVAEAQGRLPSRRCGYPRHDIADRSAHRAVSRQPQRRPVCWSEVE